MDSLLEDMTIENIPERLGGKFKLYNEPFQFDVSEGGPLWAPTQWPAPAGLPLQTPDRRHPGGRPAAGTGRTLRVDTVSTLSPLTMTPMSHAAAFTPDDSEVPVGSHRKRGSIVRIATPLLAPGSGGPNSPALTEGDTSSSDLTSLTASEFRELSGRHQPPTPLQGPGAVSVSTRTAASMLFPSIRRSLLHRDSSAISDATVSTREGETDQEVTPAQRHSSHVLSQHAHKTPSPHSPVPGSADTKPGADVSAPNSPAKTQPQWLVMVTLSALWSEFCEFCGSLYKVLTQWPMTTIVVTAAFAWCLHLRWQGKLHLMVFPVLFLSSTLYFDLLQ
jgi:hypothetical protein